VIHIVCMKCKHGLRISPGDTSGALSEVEALLGPNTEYYPDKYPCWHCEEKGAEFVPLADVSALRLVDIREVTPHEAYAAIHGLGVPEEQDCSAAAVERLFLERKVVKVRTEQIRNSHRCILKEIELEGGMKVHLGSSTYGATVYRVSQPTHYSPYSPEGKVSG